MDCFDMTNAAANTRASVGHQPMTARDRIEGFIALAVVLVGAIWIIWAL
jgi:hypothetical protein